MNLDKNDVKALCEADDKLQWWAMVLFAELSDLRAAFVNGACDDRLFAKLAAHKIDEFPRLVVHVQLQKTKEIPDAGSDIK